MITEDVAKRDRKCHLCSSIIPAGDPCIRITGFGIANNLCVNCCRDFAFDYDKAVGREIAEAREKLKG